MKDEPTRDNAAETVLVTINDITCPSERGAIIAV
jgi:hypothetical protein